MLTLDITMPERDGLTALREIIALDPTARVVMCPALGQETKVLESLALLIRPAAWSPPEGGDRGWTDVRFSLGRSRQ